MTKTISAALQAHRETGATTQCYLLKFVPAVASAFGVTSLDVDVDYNDGGGTLTYSASIGLDLSAVESHESLAVNNAEATMLFGSPFTKAAVDAGVFDYARFYLYRINWADTSQGHELVQSGRTGIIRSENLLSAVVELRSLQQQLKQNFVHLYSLLCRARFGSTTGRFPCNFDITSLWQTTTVDSLGTETDREFTAADVPAATGPNGALPFAVAIIEVLTGANAGLTVETETVSGADITLRFNAAYAFEVGDSFRIRPDCRKRFLEDCITLFDNKLNFRGEPWIPLTEESKGQFPGANVKGFGAPVSTPTPLDDGSPTPPDTPPDLTGAVSWDSVFGVPFASQTVIDKLLIIPYGGISIWFQVPSPADAMTITFITIEVAGMPGTSRTGALNTTVLDFSSGATHVWGIGGGISADVNYSGTADVTLTPGNIYIINFKNDSPTNPNWIFIRATKVTH